MRVSRARYLCFPADATVELASGATKPLEQLQLGERVRVDARGGGGGGGADSADADFAPVYFFGHADPHATATFVALRLAGGAVLTLSPTHYVPVGAARREVYAIDVVLGDVLWVVDDAAAARGEIAADDGGDDGGDYGVSPRRARPALRPAAVVAVELVERRGLFNPYVAGGGAIVVDGVLASCHSEWVLDAPLGALGAPPHVAPRVYEVETTRPVRMGVPNHERVTAVPRVDERGALCDRDGVAHTDLAASKRRVINNNRRVGPSTRRSFRSCARSPPPSGPTQWTGSSASATRRARPSPSRAARSRSCSPRSRCSSGAPARPSRQRGARRRAPPPRLCLAEASRRIVCGAVGNWSVWPQPAICNRPGLPHATAVAISASARLVVFW